MATMKELFGKSSQEMNSEERMESILILNKNITDMVKTGKVSKEMLETLLCRSMAKTTEAAVVLCVFEEAFKDLNNSLMESDSLIDSMMVEPMDKLSKEWVHWSNAKDRIRKFKEQEAKKNG